MFIPAGVVMLAAAAALMRHMRIRASRAAATNRTDILEDVAALLITALIIGGIAAIIAGVLQYAA